MNVSTIYRHLLWKEFRFLSPLVLLTIGIALLLQIVQFTTKKETHSGGIELYLAEAIPILVGMICIGISIGHERDNRSWNWFSSIPVPWKHVLSSKAIVAFMLVTFSVVVLQLSEHVLFNWLKKTDNGSTPFSERVVYPVTIAFSYFLVTFFSVLVTRQTISGLFLGLAILIFEQILLPTYAVVLMSLIIASIGLPLFRWRWTSGQYVDIGQSMVDFVSRSKKPNEVLKVNLTRLTLRKASPFQAILWQVSHQSLPIMIPAFLIGASCAVLLLQDQVRMNYPWLGAGIMLAVLATSIAIMHNDVRQHQFRFLSDRGLSVWPGLLARLGLLAIVLVLPLPFMQQQGKEFFPLLILASFSVAGIAISNSAIIALVVAILGSLTYGITVSSLTDLGRTARQNHEFLQAFFDWNIHVHIGVFSAITLLTTVWLWNVRYRRSNRLLIVRFVFLSLVAFVIASIAAIPTVVYQLKYVDPNILLGQPSAPLLSYHSLTTRHGYSPQAILFNNVSAAGALNDYRLGAGRKALEYKLAHSNRSSPVPDIDRDEYFKELQQVLNAFGSNRWQDTSYSSFSNRDKLSSYFVAEAAASILAETIFIAVFLTKLI